MAELQEGALVGAALGIKKQWARALKSALRALRGGYSGTRLGRLSYGLTVPPSRPIGGVFDAVLKVAWDDGSKQFRKGIRAFYGPREQVKADLLWASAVKAAGTGRYPILYGRGQREAFGPYRKPSLR